MTQTQQILRHLEQRGSITALDALREYSCFRLAARIKDLRADGHVIATRIVRLANGKTIASYALVREPEQLTARLA